MPHTVRLYYQTLRHLRPWQVGGRLLARVRSRLPAPRLPRASAAALDAARATAAGRGTALAAGHDPWNTREALLDGRFCFLADEERLGWTPDWRAAGKGLLWQFNLHYFHYLHLLRPEERLALCRDWVGRNPVGRGAGWHAYPTSLRIVNWCRAGLQDADVLQSLYEQAAFLYRNVETHVYGNHLLENARALAVAGACFGGEGEAADWLARGLELYARETPEQILPDGGHFERSPMYHALMLEGWLDVLALLPDAHPARPALETTARRMGDVLAALTHPDGRLALFNDSTTEIAPAPADVLAYLRRVTGHEPTPPEALPDTGYYVHRDDEAYLVIDGGPAGPDYLMAHAHADVFSYELSLGGRPFVVDTGVYEYVAGSMRDHVRSTAAHNTVEVDGRDQVECWGAFRVARRAAPSDVRFERDGPRSRFEGRFDGYVRLLGDAIEHRRALAVDGDARTVAVEDEVTGRGDHRVRSRIHLHPDVHIEETPAGVRLMNGSVRAVVQVDEGAWRWEEGWYCPAFGVRHRSRVLVLEADGALPARLAYRINY